MRLVMLKSIVILTLAFALPIALIRAQPYDGSNLRAILDPDYCEMPCFLGIRPGVTTADEVLEVFEQRRWIGVIANQIGQTSDGILTNDIEWRWSGSQPRWLGTQPGGAYIRVENAVVRTIVVRTAIPLGEVWNFLGQPVTGRVSDDSGSGTPRAAYEGAYDAHFAVSVAAACPAESPWLQPAIFTYSERRDVEPNDGAGIESPNEIFSRCLSAVQALNP